MKFGVIYVGFFESLFLGVKFVSKYRLEDV